MDALVEGLLKDMRLEAQTALDIVRRYNDREIVDDPVVSRAFAHAFMLIGEIAGQTPEAVRSAQPQIAWSEARALRNRIVHGYRTLVPRILIETARRDLPVLIDQLDTLLGKTE